MRGMREISVLAVAAILAMGLGGAGCSSEENVDAGPPSMQQSEEAAPGATGAPAQQPRQAEEEEEK